VGGLQKAARSICGGARRKRGRLFVGGLCKAAGGSYTKARRGLSATLCGHAKEKAGAYGGSFKAWRRRFAAVAGVNKAQSGRARA